jgi:nondiscriminating glutamyl-tRNA synthetase
MTEPANTESVRVRFAPSPSGYLHIGGARTALFNFLFARRHGGIVVLRIEDTDRERSTPEAIQAISDGLRYLGLEWDEGPEVGGEYGPYLQSERAANYGRYVEQLLADGKAYRAFSAEKLSVEDRAQSQHSRDRIELSRVDRGLDAAEAQTRADAGESHVIRFRVPVGETTIPDLVRGSVTFKNSELDDFIICRSDGSCVYNFVVACDDHDMRISHVLRGEDHLSNTPKQMLLASALGFPLPHYGHFPLILGQGGGKLSKRHAAVSVMEYSDKGYLPEAMINFLVRLGWSFDDKQEIFSLSELGEKFSLDGVSKSGAVYDLKKLDHLGGHYVRERSREDFVEWTLPYLVQAGYVSEDQVAAERPRLAAMLALEQERLSYLSQIVEKVRYYFEAPQELDKGARKALRKKKDIAPVIVRYAAALPTAVPAERWTVDDPGPLEEHARAFVETEGVALGDLAQPLRAIVSGRGATPGLFDVLAVLGRDAVLERLARTDEVFAQALAE